ncbi:MAG: hypothetical protein JWQ97_896 [Phenylobacterium sp.]|nr:hypothetical protein [Phenylobacterium sp.]
MPRLAPLVLALGLWLALTLPAGAAAPLSASPFSDWAAVVVAGDWHAHSGGPSEAFDNARRDVSRALLSAGFQPQNLRELSVRPERYRDHPAKSSVEHIYDALSSLSRQAQGGCLVYFSSHGAPEGVVVDDDLLSPGVLASMLDETCGRRPTIAIVSACFSGVFVPALAANNRMVLTAARPDRSSFGCGEADRYPYFDDCFLKSFGQAHDFPQLGRLVQACVAARETQTHMSPPSEPQLWIGPQLAPLLPLYPLPAQGPHPAQF